MQHNERIQVVTSSLSNYNGVEIYFQSTLAELNISSTWSRSKGNEVDISGSVWKRPQWYCKATFLVPQLLFGIIEKF